MRHSVATDPCGPQWRTALAVVLMASMWLARSDFQTAAGEPFTKIANDGTPLPTAAAQGSDPGDWACTRDERSGLVWEVKTRDRGLRDANWIYTPYDGNPETNGGYPGYRDKTSGECVRARMDGGSCNTEAYVRAVNESGLCGFSNWRLPTAAELVAVSGQTASEPPSATTRMLPNMAAGWYWTGVERIGATVFPRVILLPPAARPEFYDGSYFVLVVCGGETPCAGY